MCCNDFSKLLYQQSSNNVDETSASAGQPAYVEQILVAAPLPDGYWINEFPFLSKAGQIPDIIGFGLGYEGKPASIKLFENPKNTGFVLKPILLSAMILISRRASGWKVIEIQHLDYPVAMGFADLTGDGYNDGSLNPVDSCKN